MITIERVLNGYLITHTMDGGSEKYVFTEKESEVQTFADLLWQLNDLIGPSTSRYDEERIQISVVPGDKHHSQL